MSYYPVLEVNNLTVSFSTMRAVENVTFCAPAQQMVGIIGPNGAGKTTLIKAILGLLEVEKGEIKVFNKPVKAVRKKIAYVPQHRDIDLDFPVLAENVVMMGRYPHLGWFGRPGPGDRQIVDNCLEYVGMQDCKNKQVSQLSGGQLQRIFLARALAQEAEVFFLDEPFAGVDIASETIIINLLNELKEKGKTIFIVYHDLKKAASFFDKLLLLNRRLIAFGNREKVLRADALKQAYQDNMIFLPPELLDKNRSATVVNI